MNLTGSGCVIWTVLCGILFGMRWENDVGFNASRDYAAWRLVVGEDGGGYRTPMISMCEENHVDGDETLKALAARAECIESFRKRACGIGKLVKSPGGMNDRIFV